MTDTLTERATFVLSIQITIYLKHMYISAHIHLCLCVFDNQVFVSKAIANAQRAICGCRREHKIHRTHTHTYAQCNVCMCVCKSVNITMLAYKY